MDSDMLDEPMPAAQREEALSDQLRLYARDLKEMLQRERRQSAELTAAKARLGRLDRLKLDFLSLISHELRTPLTSMGMVALLDPEQLDPHHAEVVRVISAGYARLERFVSRAVEYFRVLAHLDDEAVTTIELSALVLDRLEALGLGSCAEVVRTPEPCEVRGSAESLERVIDTVLENAVKHSNGTLKLSVKVDRTESSKVRLQVRDYGKGFPPEMASEITRALTPGDVMHHSHGSTINLALAVQIVENLGGSLVASSEGLGSGATFVIELPLEPAITAILPRELK
jgi:signal transduction histidine kinase